MKAIHEDSFKYVDDISVSSFNEQMFLLILFGVQHQLGLDQRF